VKARGCTRPHVAHLLNARTAASSSSSVGNLPSPARPSRPHSMFVQRIMPSRSTRNCPESCRYGFALAQRRARPRARSPSYSRRSRQSHIPKVPRTMKATLLGQSGMSWLPAVTRTRRRTRSNCARATSQNTIAATSDAGFFISVPSISFGHRPRTWLTEHDPGIYAEGHRVSTATPGNPPGGEGPSS